MDNFKPYTIVPRLPSWTTPGFNPNAKLDLPQEVQLPNGQVVSQEIVKMILEQFKNK